MQFQWDENKVVHCYREDDSIIRIISARKATHTEEKQYNAQKGR